MAAENITLQGCSVAAECWGLGTLGFRIWVEGLRMYMGLMRVQNPNPEPQTRSLSLPNAACFTGVHIREGSSGSSGTSSP